MKTFFLLPALLLSAILLNAQEISDFQLNNPLKGKERPINTPVYFLNQGKQLPDSLIEACGADLSLDSLTAYLQSLENFGTRFMLADNHREVAEWIKNKFYSMGYTNARLDSFECVVQWPMNSGIFDTTWQYNVFATLTGQDNPGVEVIIGGHYDAIMYSGGDPYMIAPGADDNGSSVAATLEIARVLKAKNFAPSSSIVFAAWAGEERGMYGSVNKVIQAITSGEQVKTYINMDMIANEPDTTDWQVKINLYDGSEWLGNIATEVALNHTTLFPTGGTVNSIGSDSYMFYLGGMAPVYFCEDHFSLNYHKPSDLVVNCNMPYCKEMTKLAMGTLLTTDVIPSRVKYELFNPGSGNSLIAQWLPNPETDISGYKVRMGYSSGNYTQTIVTQATQVNFNNLSPDTVYFIAVSAVNNQGYEGPATEYSDRPALVTMDQGILIVDDSDGGIWNPSDSAVDSFYRELLQNYQVTEYDAYQQQQILLSDLGKYSSVLWHINKQTSITVLNRNLKEVVNYLKLGGNILFTLYQPERAIYKLQSYPNQWGAGSFFYDYLGIGMNDMNPSSFFNTALPEIPGIPLMTTDHDKTVQAHNYHINYVEALWPIDNNDILYRYGTDYDTTTLQGDMFGTPVALKYTGNTPYNWKTVILSFPLYYMNFSQAKGFTDYVMSDYFGESSIGIDEPFNNQLSVIIVPNPALDHAEIYYSLKNKSIVEIQVYNALGEKVKFLSNNYKTAGNYSQIIDLKGMTPGLYFIKLKAGKEVIVKKLIINSH